MMRDDAEKRQRGRKTAQTLSHAQIHRPDTREIWNRTDRAWNEEFFWFFGNS
jgi:hypothetical protein